MLLLHAANFGGMERAWISWWYFELFCAFFLALELQVAKQCAIGRVVIIAESERMMLTS